MLFQESQSLWIDSNRRRALVSILLLGLAACEPPAEVSQAPVLETGYWRASITLPGGDIETGIEISSDGDAYSASLINGQERVRIDEVSFSDNKLLLRFPAFNNEIRATLSSGRLDGELTIVRQHGVTQVMPFAATFGGKRSAEAGASPDHDLSGRWAVKFHNADGSDSASIGEFAQRGSRLFGTFLNPNGDHRFLAGHVRDDNFKLSTFDGAHAFIFSGQVNADGNIENADFWSSTSFHQKWSASRSDDIELPDAFSRTYLKPGYDKLEFSFPDIEGNPVSLQDEKFADKVVIVTIAGSWCPNCNDEARFLAPFYREHRERGLEIVALMFEHFPDFDRAALQVDNLRQKFDIQYEMLVAGLSDKTEAASALPALSGILAFPTTVFIDRQGRVRDIHTGFTGPGTGEHYEQLQQKFYELVSTMLDEPADLIESLTTETAAPEAE